MYVRQAVLLLFLLSDWCSASTRIWYRRTSCGKPGFICFPKIGQKKTLVIECPSKIKEYHIYINEFNGPNTLEFIKIQNCKTLTILFRCSKYKWEKKNLKQLQISNIEKLNIMNVKNYQSVLPPVVVFQNIKTIGRIPSHVFTQTNQELNLVKCVLPSYKFESLHFRNVSIDIIPVGTFFLNDFVNLTFTDVRIKTMNTGSFFVKQNGVFLLQNSNIDLVEPLAVEVDGPKVIVSNNVFGDISTSGFKVTSDTFNFSDNTVDNFLHSQAMSVASQNIFISSNRFQYLKTGALSNIGSSVAGFGSYEFSRNKMYFVEDDSLVPALSTYKDVEKQIISKENIFSCQCWQSDLLMSKIGMEDRNTTTDAFYKALFDEQSENTCFSNCNLPLSHAKEKITQGKCNNDITIDDLCEAKRRTATELYSTTEISSSSIPDSDFSEFTYGDSSSDSMTSIESTTVTFSSSTELSTDSSFDTSSVDGDSVTNNEPTEIAVTKNDLKIGKTIFLLPLSRHALTTATSLKTTIRPTTYKFVKSTQTNENSNYGSVSKKHKESMKHQYITTGKELFTTTSNPGSNDILESSSKSVFYFSYFLTFLCFVFLQMFL